MKLEIEKYKSKDDFDIYDKKSQLSKEKYQIKINKLKRKIKTIRNDNQDILVFFSYEIIEGKLIFRTV